MASSYDDKGSMRKAPTGASRTPSGSIREAEMRRATACIRRSSLVATDSEPPVDLTAAGRTPAAGRIPGEVTPSSGGRSEDWLPLAEPIRIDPPADRGKGALTLREAQRLHDQARSAAKSPTQITHRTALHGPRPYSPSLFALLFAAASTMVIANSPPMDKLIMLLQRDNATARASTFDPRGVSALFAPLFGPQAVETCSEQCTAQHSHAVCQQICQKLSLSEYAHRIRLNESSPESDALRISRSCIVPEQSMTQFTAPDRWEPAARSAVSTLQEFSAHPPVGDFARSRLALDRLRPVMQSLALPADGDRSETQRQAATRELLEASCLRAHHALSELAVILSDQNKDPFSVRYYADLARRLGKAATDAELQATKDAQPLLQKQPAKNG